MLKLLLKMVVFSLSALLTSGMALSTLRLISQMYTCFRLFGSTILVPFYDIIIFPAVWCFVLRGRKGNKEFEICVAKN